MREMLERQQGALVERLREWISPTEIRWLDAELTRIAWLIANTRF
jgi:hypothetical protein